MAFRHRVNLSPFRNSLGHILDIAHYSHSVTDSIPQYNFFFAPAVYNYFFASALFWRFTLASI